MNVEVWFCEMIGDVVGCLYIVCSWNDQVVLDFCMWVCDQCDVVVEVIDVLIKVLLGQVEVGVDWVMLGFIYL